jgi:hypothetical protein
MLGSPLPIAAFSLVTMSLALTPAVAGASHRSKHSPRLARVAKSIQSQMCVKAPIEVVAGAESATFALAKCDGTAIPAGVDQLSVMARPATAPKPTEPISVLGKVRGPELAPGVRRIDSRLVERLELVVDHFRKEGQSARVVVISGYRPRNSGSYHGAARALDFRIEGIRNEALVTFCKTLGDTGCGYYPNGAFVHMDVRAPGTGHVAWVDTSRAGEAPHYVPNAPEPAAPADAAGAKAADAAGAKADAMDAKADAAGAKLPGLPVNERRESGGASEVPAKKGSEEHRFL